jgi:hypothetical protein
MHILIITPQLLQGATLSNTLRRHNVTSLHLSPLTLSYHEHIDADGLVFPHTLTKEQWNLVLPFLSNLSTHIPLIFLTVSDRHFFQHRPLDRFLSQSIFLDTAIPLSQIPFLIREIVQKSTPHKDLQIGQISLDRMTRTLHFKNKAIELSKKEFFLFELFLLNTGRIISRDYIIDYVWDKRDYVSQNTIDVYISRLRKKISPYSPKPLIRTVPCLGYQLDL